MNTASTASADEDAWRVEQRRVRALELAHETFRDSGDAGRILSRAAEFEAFMAGGAQAAAPMPKRVIHRFTDGTLTVEIYRD